MFYVIGRKNFPVGSPILLDNPLNVDKMIIKLEQLNATVIHLQPPQRRQEDHEARAAQCKGNAFTTPSTSTR